MTALAHLSLYRVTGTRRVPSPRTNEQRVQELRARLPVQFGNATLTDMIRAAEYAREAMADSAPSSDDYMENDL